MIRNEGLRHRSYYTEQEYTGEIVNDLTGLDSDEIEFVLEMLTSEELGKEVSFVEYKHDPVDMHTFLMDPYYMGVVGRTLFPKWIEDLIEMFSGNYHEAIIGGAIGTGKSTFAHVAVIRMLYEASCLRNPQASYGIMDGTPICFANVGVNKTNAQKVVFEGIASKLQLSKYFMDQYTPSKKSSKEIVFADNIQITPGSSTETGVIGMNILGGIIDESNFFDSGKMKAPQKASHARWGHYSKAEVLYSAIQRRMKSRFMRYGKLPGILLLISSKKTVHDFTEKRIRESQGDPTVFVRDYAQYDVKDRKYFSPKTFSVLIGNDRVSSRILAENEVEEFKGKVDDGGKEMYVIDVPDDFRTDFENDVEGAIRDVAGIATHAISNFIQKREKIYEMINHSRSHPFSEVSYDMSKGGGFLWNLIVRQNDSGEYEPLLNPKAVRHAHLDLSLTGCSAGLAIGHISHYTDVVRKRRGPDGSISLHKEIAPYIVFDIVLQIIPPLGDEIDLAGVRALIYDLAEHGFPIRFVSMDTFQSAETRQHLTKKGFRAEHISTVSSTEPYDCAKTALYENRVDCYNYEILNDELKGLEKNEETNKIDKKASGSKDVADCFAGVIVSLTTKVKHRLPAMELGTSESKIDDKDDWILQTKHANFDKDGKPVERPLPFLKG